MPHSPPPIKLSDFYKIGLAANFLAMMGIMVMNLATPVEFMTQRIHDLSEHHWAGVMALRLSILILITFISSLPYMIVVKRVLKPVMACLIQSSPPPGLLTSARERTINLPFIMVPINLGLWILIPMVIFSMLYYLDLMIASTAITFSIRSTMVGLLSSAILFFRLEYHARKKLVPHFFPNGRLNRVPNTAQLPIERRIRAFYRMGTLIPLAHILLTLLALLIQVDTNPMDTKTYARSVFFFSFVVFCLFVLGSGIITKMLTRSITEPVNDILSAVRALREGDYTTQVAVASNDELGILGDAFNRTIRGLGERNRLRDAFGRYVDPKIRDEILSGNIPLDGEYKDVTVMFADIRNFTPLTASRDPKEVVLMLNGYFKTMAAAIQDHQGLILQFLGDEIYAVFGAPMPSSTHARDAVQAAMEMESRLEALNREFLSKGFPPICHGIGIHTGRVLAANIGSPDRLSYLLVGDTVNLASRLQTLTRDLDTHIVVSQKTVSLLPENISGLIPFDRPVRVKGRKEPVGIYTLR